MNKKILLSILLVICLIFSVMGCGKKNSISTELAEIESESEKDNLKETEALSDTQIETQEKEPETPNEPEMIEILVEEQYTYTDLELTMYAQDSVNVRALPAISGEKLGALSKNESVSVTGQCNETKWYRILFHDQTAYVSNLYLGESMVVEEEEAEVPDSGYIVCIDPGHYKGRDTTDYENSYGYEEGIITLKTAKYLRDELKKYGINSYLTREGDSITLGGYTNYGLDGSHVALRGEYAQGADLFVSIHTNANMPDANGYSTYGQPLEISKTIVIVNSIMMQSEAYMKFANEVGKAVTNVNASKGINLCGDFVTVTKDSVRYWDSEYNDSLTEAGTVCYRLGARGDYYGVLRGSSEVSVPGMIIEHAHHSTQEVRRLAIEDNLALEWAKADAYGIAKGFGLVD